MARPKKAPVKSAPVKRTRRPKDPTSPERTKVPEAWIDEQLRKECIQIAADNGSSIGSLVEDARGIYYFVKGISMYEKEVSLQGFTLGSALSPFVPTSGLSQHLEGVEPAPDASLTTYPAKSKLDAHTL